MTSKFALVIANTEYQDVSFAKLTTPSREAEEFAQVLRELAAFDDVQVLLNEGEGKTRRSIARFFAERKRDDLLLLYFSGHGVRNEVGHLFLATNDTEINILEASSIPAEFVTNSMNNSRSQRQLLILDCCNSGAFAHGSKAASGVGKSMGIATAFEGSGFGRVVLTATDATQYAWEGDKVIGHTQKTVFTHFLIEGLKGDADLDGDGRIHVDELYDYAYEQVVSRTPKQTPGKWSYRQQGDIILRENLKPRDVRPVSLPLELLEMFSHPNSGVRRAGIQELISFLDSKHLGLTRAAQEKLQEIAENDDSLTLRKIASDTLISHGVASEPPIPVKTIKENISDVTLPSIEIVQAKKEKKPALSHVEDKSAEISVVSPHHVPSATRAKRNVKEGGQEPSLSVSKRERKKPVISQSAIPAYLPERFKPNLRLYGVIAGTLLVLTLSLWGGANLLNNQPFTTAEPTQTLQPTATRTPPPAQTNTPSPTQTSVPPTPTLGIGSTVTGKDGMTLLYVPSGEFTMGSNNGGSDEKPVHKVHLDALWIDKTEVTNAMYIKCVQDGVCTQPRQTRSATRDNYYGNSDFDNYPVIYVDWDMAKTYCEWAGRSLPTEAEWEKAARGENASEYPWGNNTPGSDLLNYRSDIGDTTEVGKYPKGASPYGTLDMAGNAWEWVADWYSDTYYFGSPTFNPSGPDAGNYRVLRGGSWYAAYGGLYIAKRGQDNASVVSWNRNSSSPDIANQYFSFRCAMSATP